MQTKYGKGSINKNLNNSMVVNVIQKFESFFDLFFEKYQYLNEYKIEKYGYELDLNKIIIENPDILKTVEYDIYYKVRDMYEIFVKSKQISKEYVYIINNLYNNIKNNKI